MMTKCDKKGPVALAAQIEKDKELLAEFWEELPPIFTTSSVSGNGREELLAYIEDTLINITP